MVRVEHAGSLEKINLLGKCPPSGGEDLLPYGLETNQSGTDTSVGASGVTPC